MPERGIGPAPPAAAASATGLAPSSASANEPSSPQPEAEAARSVLAELQRTLRDASGRPRTGLLRLRRGDAGDAMPRFEHQSSFHLNRVSRSQVQDTARALRRVFAAAGLTAQAQQQLELYLRENGERAQVSRIVELIDQHFPRGSGGPGPDPPSS